LKSILKGIYSILPLSLRTRIYFHRLVFLGLPIIPNPTLAEDGLISQHLVEFLDDPKFMRAYAQGKATGALKNHPGDIRFRAYIACWAATQAMSLDGDFVECGVGHGLLSKTIVEYLDFSKVPKNFFLFDTYAGIPLEQGKASEIENMQRLNETHYAEPYFEKVAVLFSDFANIKLVKGILPESLEKQNIGVISYLSIDLNNAKAEIGTVEILWERIVKGGVILLDDYAYGPEFLEQKRSWDTFAQSKKISILTLPTGQGLIIKQ
jgi:O-methyltransferase